MPRDRVLQIIEMIDSNVTFWPGLNGVTDGVVLKLYKHWLKLERPSGLHIEFRYDPKGNKIVII